MSIENKKYKSQSIELKRLIDIYKTFINNKKYGQYKCYR